MAELRTRNTHKKTAQGHLIWQVLVGDSVIGTVYKHDGSKTGFRQGRCVGQVPHTSWICRDNHNTEHRNYNRMGTSGWRTKRLAAEYLKERIDG